MESSPAEAAVNECLLQGGTLREASTVFKGITGETISLTALGRHYHSIMARAEQTKMMNLLADKLVACADAPPGWNTVGLARQLLQTQALEAAAELPDEAFEGLSAERLSLLISRMERSAAVAERARLQGADLVAKVRQKIIARLHEDLRDDPDLLQKISEFTYRKWEEQDAREAEGRG